MAELTDEEWYALVPWVRGAIIHRILRIVIESVVYIACGQVMAENLAAAHNPHREDES